jgi:hypothetical protein
MSRKKRNKGRLADKFGGVEGTNRDSFSAGKEKKKDQDGGVGKGVDLCHRHRVVGVVHVVVKAPRR